MWESADTTRVAEPSSWLTFKHPKKMACVEPHDTVLLKLNDGDTLFVEIVPNRKLISCPTV